MELFTIRSEANDAPLGNRPDLIFSLFFLEKSSNNFGFKTSYRFDIRLILIGTNAYFMLFPPAQTDFTWFVNNISFYTKIDTSNE